MKSYFFLKTEWGTNSFQSDCRHVFRTDRCFNGWPAASVEMEQRHTFLSFHQHWQCGIGASTSRLKPNHHISSENIVSSVVEWEGDWPGNLDNKSLLLDRVRKDCLVAWRRGGHSLHAQVSNTCSTILPQRSTTSHDPTRFNHRNVVLESVHPDSSLIGLYLLVVSSTKRILWFHKN